MSNLTNEIRIGIGKFANWFCLCAQNGGNGKWILLWHTETAILYVMHHTLVADNENAITVSMELLRLFHMRKLQYMSVDMSVDMGVDMGARANSHTKHKHIEQRNPIENLKLIKSTYHTVFEFAVSVKIGNSGNL